MKVGTKTQSTVQPEKFSINELADGKLELALCENIVEVERMSEMDGEQVVENGYEYDLLLETCKVNTYEELVDALVGLKYSYGDEFALIRKGTSNSRNSEYVNYIAYVDECKSFAKQYLGI